MDNQNRKIIINNTDDMNIVNKIYSPNQLEKICMTGKNSEIHLSLTDSDKIQVYGALPSNYKLKVDNKILEIERDFIGYLILPNFKKVSPNSDFNREDFHWEDLDSKIWEQEMKLVKLIINNDYGNTSGSIINPANISTVSGNIDLLLQTSRHVTADRDKTAKLKINNMTQLNYFIDSYYPHQARPLSYFNDPLHINLGKEGSAQITLCATVHDLIKYQK